jgi:hypothetical protein
MRYGMAETAAIVMGYQSGATLRELNAIYGGWPPDISACLKQQGVPRRPAAPRPRRAPLRDRAAYMREYRRKKKAAA